MKTSLLPGEVYPNRRRRAQLERKCWYVRLAEREGVSFPPENQPGLATVIATILPELFPTEAAARRWAWRRPWEIVAEHWKNDVTESRIRLPGSSHWVKILTRNRTRKASHRRLRALMPPATEIENEVE